METKTIPELIKEVGPTNLARATDLDKEYIHRVARYVPKSLNEGLADQLSINRYNLMKQYQKERKAKKRSTIEKINSCEPVDPVLLIEVIKDMMHYKLYGSKGHPHQIARVRITDHYRLSKSYSALEWSSLFGVSRNAIVYYESGRGKHMPPSLTRVLLSCRLTPYVIDQLEVLSDEFKL